MSSMPIRVSLHCESRRSAAASIVSARIREVNPAPTPKAPGTGVPGAFESSDAHCASEDLLDDLGHRAGADGAATLTDREAEALFHGDRLDELDRHVGGVAGHDHLGALGQRDDAGDVGGTEVELRAVVRVERVVTPTRILGKDVRGSLEVRVRGDRAGLDDNLATLNVFTLRATQQQTTVLAGPRLVELLVEHLDTSDR